MNKLGQTYKLAQMVTRGSSSRMVSTSPAAFSIVKDESDVHPKYIEIRKKYEKYQIDDGIPVHLKGGTKDYILYYFTIGLGAIGLAMGLNFIRVSAWPPKAKKEE